MPPLPAYTPSHKKANVSLPKPQKPPAYQMNSPSLEKGIDSPNLVDSGHSRTQSYQLSNPQTVWDKQYYNMNRPPQFWGASNSNWQRSKRMDPDQGSHKSKYSNESERSTMRRTGGPPDMSSQYSVHSGRSIVPGEQEDHQMTHHLT